MSSSRAEGLNQRATVWSLICAAQIRLFHNVDADMPLSIFIYCITHYRCRVQDSVGKVVTITCV